MEEIHLDELDINDLDDVIKDVDISSNDVPIEPKPKRKRTPNQIKAGLKNLELARKTRMKNAQKRKQKKEDEDYDNFEIQNQESESEPESDSFDDEPIERTKKKHLPGKPKINKKEIHRLDKLESMVAKILQAQKKVRQPKKVSQTIIQIPKTNTGGNIRSNLLRLFD